MLEVFTASEIKKKKICKEGVVIIMTGENQVSPTSETLSTILDTQVLTQQIAPRFSESSMTGLAAEQTSFLRISTLSLETIHLYSFYFSDAILLRAQTYQNFPKI